jgi:hypothetical protein
MAASISAEIQLASEFSFSLQIAAADTRSLSRETCPDGRIRGDVCSCARAFAIRTEAIVSLVPFEPPQDAGPMEGNPAAAVSIQSA